jgi:hypothetical protein
VNCFAEAVTFNPVGSNQASATKVSSPPGYGPRLDAKRGDSSLADFWVLIRTFLAVRCWFGLAGVSFTCLERLPVTQEVAGSSPVAPAKFPRVVSISGRRMELVESTFFAFAHEWPHVRAQQGPQK